MKSSPPISPGSPASAARAGTGEISYYGCLAGALNAVGATLKPRVFCVPNLRNRGAGFPDMGLFADAEVGATDQWLLLPVYRCNATGPLSASRAVPANERFGSIVLKKSPGGIQPALCARRAPIMPSDFNGPFVASLNRPASRPGREVRPFLRLR